MAVNEPIPRGLFTHIMVNGRQSEDLGGMK